MDQHRLDKFKEQLDQHHAWPSVYTFKFIVPAGKVSALKELFRQHTPQEKASKNGNYTSFTYQMMMPSSQAVIDIYIAASKIEGLIAL
ncbi:MAG: DUF493 domain-containing protein [Cyclobacteriaceae bacterium]|nr:DUF493 domain-containing protein [Cyclobacteriaceae bacterium]